MKKYWLLLIAFFVGFIVPVTAQKSNPYKGSPIIRNYNSEEIGTFPQIWYIEQDARGIMYFATNNGLLEYDGVSWKVFPVRNFTTVRSIKINIEGKIFVGAKNEFGYFMPDTSGALVYNSISKLLPDTLPAYNDVWRTLVTSHGVYFVSSATIFRWYQDTLEVLPVDLAPVFAFLINDNIYVNVKNKGIALLKNGEFSFLPNCEELYTETGYFHINTFSEDKLLITTQLKGSFTYNLQTKVLNKHNPNLFIKNYLKENIVYAACEIGNDKIAFATKREGIIVVKKNGELVHIVNQERGLQSNYVFSLFNDKDNNLWVGSQMGISRIDLSYPVVKYDKNQKLNETPMNALFHKGVQYISTSNQLFYLPNYSPKIKADNHTLQVVPGVTYCWDLFAVRNKLIAICFNNICVVDNFKSKIIHNAEKYFCGNYSEKYPNKLFIGTKTGLNIATLDLNMDLENIEISDYFEIEGITEEIRSIVFEDNNRVWLATQNNGIILLQFEDTKLTKYTIIKYDSDYGLPTKLIDLYIGFINNNFNVFTPKGIYKIDYSRGKQDSLIRFVHDNSWGDIFTKDSTLVIDAKTIDENKYFLVGTRSGVFDFSVDSNTFFEAPFKRINSTAVVSANRKRFINLATSSCLYVYDLNANKDYSKKYNVLIRKVKTTNDSIVFNGAYFSRKNGIKTCLEQPAEFKPIFKYKDRSIVFEYAAAFYEEAEKIQYQYKLENFDEEWSPWSLETKAVYTNIPEGSYVFKVRAKNIYENESVIASYELTILPPWYRTFWFYILYIILFVLFIFLIVKLNAKRLQKDKKILESIVKERTIELQERNQEIQQQNEEIRAQTEELFAVNEHLVEMDKFKEGMTGMIVHDLKNPLSTILGITDKPEVKQAGQQMLNMVLNILDIQKFENAEIKLQLTNINLQVCINKAVKDVQLLLEKKSIFFENLISSELFIKVDVDILIRVFVNLLTNAIKFTPNNGKITVNAFDNENSRFINFFITDTGEGIEEDKLRVVFDKFTQVQARKSGAVRSTGLGLAFCKLAINGHGGKIGASSELGKGTTFELQIPRGVKPQLQDNEYEKEFNNSAIANFILEPNEIDYLFPYCERLNKYTVYEYSDLINILNEIDSKNSKSIQAWKKTVENSIRACNEEKFYDLIKMKNNE